MRKCNWLLSALLLCALVFTTSASAETPTVPKGLVRQTDGKLLPQPGYAWLNNKADDLRVRWVPRVAHPTAANVLAGDKENNWTPVAGYKWLNDTPNDLRVVKTVAAVRVGPTDEEIGKAVIKTLGAMVTHHASKPQRDDGIFEAVARGVARAARDELIDSALEDLFPKAPRVERAAVRNLAVLALDGRLAQDRDRVLTHLRKTNPDMADAVQVAEFLIAVAKAAENSR